MIPASTYRLQLSADFTFDDAAAVVPYLADLGVGAVYCSPILQSSSVHGYDVVDPTRIDEGRGGQAGFERLASAAHDAGLGVVVDIVPNHQGVGTPEHNPAWWDVLRYGRESGYADWFDIDWSRPITLPILDGTLDLDDLWWGDDRVYVGDLALPLAPDTRSLLEPERLAAQHWRLIDWRRADAELNYRRFFTITSLAGVRCEDRAVFDATHTLTLELVSAGLIDGLRVDHPDGLRDPEQYFAWLREAIGPQVWLVGEKILAPGEAPPAWAWDGTVGYDALRDVTSVLVDPARCDDADRALADLTGAAPDFADVRAAATTEVATTMFGAELNRIAAAEPDLPQPEARAALAAIAAEFGVYRTYLPHGYQELFAAAQRAADAHPRQRAMIDQLGGRLTSASRESAARFQQLTGAVVAKGVEDTAFYRYARLVALNEVGGDPGAFGLGLDDFHAAQDRRQRQAPRAMACLSTHDTKRAEDIRARLVALAEPPYAWWGFAERFVREGGIPDFDFAYLLAQVLLGAGLVERARLHSYAVKAAREAAERTLWTAPDAAFEGAVADAIDRCFDDPTWRQAWQEAYDHLSASAWSNALAAKAIQLTMPGVPDVYQGTEVIEDSLVDPDNRRRVDFAGLAARLPREAPPEDPGAAKHWLVRQILRTRRDHPGAFADYRRVPVSGPGAERVVAFDRGGAVTVVRRLPGAADLTDTVVDLPRGGTDVVAGGEYAAGPTPAADLLAAFPAAVILS